MDGRHGRWLGFLGAAGVMIAACSSASEPYPSASAFCAALANEQCQIAAACAVPKDNCTMARKALCAEVAARLPANRQYTAGNAPACIDKTHAYYAADHVPLTPTEVAELDDACGRVFSGTVDRNGACASTFDCAGSLICDKGRCGERTVKTHAGDGCANAGEVCDAGLYCTATDRICAPKKKQGEACSAIDAPCLETLLCNLTCMPRFATGAACTSNDQCEAAAPYCDVYNNVCDDGIRFSVSQKALCAEFGATP